MSDAPDAGLYVLLLDYRIIFFNRTNFTRS